MLKFFCTPESDLKIPNETAAAKCKPTYRRPNDQLVFHKSYHQGRYFKHISKIF